MAWSDPERGKAYYRARYQAKRDAILAKRKAFYDANPEAKLANNRRYYEKNKDTILARQKAARASQPKPPKPVKPTPTPEERAARWRRNRLLRIYGTEHPEPGQVSLDGRMRYMRRKPKPWSSPPKPIHTPTQKPEASSSVQTAPQKPSPQARATHSPKPNSSPSGTSQSPSTTRSTATTAARPSQPPTPRWVPQPISRWEPGLDKQALREFHT